MWLNLEISVRFSQCSTLVRNTVVRATFKVNGKPPILGSRSPLTPRPIDLIFDTGDYVSHMTPHAKNCKKIGPAGPTRQRGATLCEGQMRLFFIFYFLIFLFLYFSCPPLETTFLHGSTPFLRQMACFGGDWFPRGLVVRVKNFPLLNPQKPQIFGPFWT